MGGIERRLLGNVVSCGQFSAEAGQYRLLQHGAVPVHACRMCYPDCPFDHQPVSADQRDLRKRLAQYDHLQSFCGGHELRSVLRTEFGDSCCKCSHAGIGSSFIDLYSWNHYSS